MNDDRECQAQEWVLGFCEVGKELETTSVGIFFLTSAGFWASVMLEELEGLETLGFKGRGGMKNVYNLEISK